MSDDGGWTRAGGKPTEWQRVFVAEHPLQAATMATALEGAGLHPQLRGMELWSAAVEILFSEGAAPSVWVPATETEEALAVVARLQAPQTKPAIDWHCGQCGEKVPGGFETCWRCGALSPALSDDEVDGSTGRRGGAT